MPNQVQAPNTTLADILTELKDTGNLYDGAILKLLKAAVPLGPTMDLATLDAAEADFTGYAASSTIVWGSVFFTPSGAPVLVGGMKTFTVGATPTVLNTIYGWYVTNAGGTKLLWAKQLDTPVPLSAAGQGLVIIPSTPAYAAP